MFLTRSLFVRLALIASMIFLPATQRAAADNVWTATTDGTWSHPANWSGGAPVSDPALQLTFNAAGATGYAASNDIGPITLNTLSFNNGGSGTITLNASLPANAITFAGANPALSNNGAGAVTINAPLVFAANTQVTNAGNGNLTLGATTFADGITITNAGTGAFTLADKVAYVGTNVNLNLANTGGGAFLIGNLGANVSGNINLTAGSFTFAGDLAGDLFGNGVILNLASGTSFNFAHNAEGFGGISGSGDISLGSAGISFAAAGDRTYTGSINGTGGLGQNNTGTLSLGGQNSYSGTTTIQGGGTIKALAANALSSNSLVTLVPGQGNLNINGFDQTIAGLTGGASITNIDLSAATLTISNLLNNTRTYYGFFSGNGNLTVNGLGTQTVVGANTYTGTTTINAGVLKLISAQNLATGAGVFIDNGGTLDAAFPSDSAWTAPLSGNGTFIKSGAGALTMSAANPGANLSNLAVNNGALVLNYATNAGSKVGANPALQVGSGKLGVIGNNAAATSVTFNNTTLSGAAKVAVTSGNNQNATVALGSLTRGLGVGSTVDFSLTNTGTGVAAITTTAQNGANGILGGHATVNGTDWAATGTGAGPFNVAALPAGSYAPGDWSAGKHTDVTSSITKTAATNTASVRFNTAGANTVTLTGTNQVATGGILVTPNVGANTSTITGGTITAPKDGEIYLQQYNTAAPLTIGSVLGNVAGTTITVGGATFNQVSAAGGKFVIANLASTAGIYPGMRVTTGTGVNDIVSADNVHVVSVDSPTQVTVVISALQTNNNTTPASLYPILSQSNATVSFLSGTNVIKSGPGTVNLTASNTFNGLLVLNEGVVSVATAANLGQATIANGTSSIYFNGGTLQMTGNISPGSAAQPWFFGPNGGTIDTAGLLVNDTKQGNSVYGSGTFTKTGLGTLNIGSNNSLFNGQVFVNQGVLKFTSNQFTNVLGMTIANGGQYQLQDDAIGGNWNLAGNSVLTLNGAGPAGASIAGAFALTDQSPNDATKTGVTANFNTIVNLASDTTFGIYNGTGTAPNHVSNLVLARTVAGPGSLTKIGSGILTLSDAFNSYGGTNGKTTVAEGTVRIAGGSNRLPVLTTLQLGDVGGTTSGTFDLNGQSQTVAGLTTAGAGTANQVINAVAATPSTLTVNYNGATPQTFAGQIGGGTPAAPANANINFVKSGTGTLSLTGANTYTGSTTVAAGTLRATNNTVARPYTVNDGAGLTIANADGATPFATSTLTLGTAGTTNLGFEINGTQAPAAGLLSVATTDGLTLNGTVNLSIASLNTLSPGTTYTLISYAGALQGAGFNAFNPTLNLPARVNGSLVNNTANHSIDLAITAVDFLKWTGANNGNWDTATSNWKLNQSGAAATYIQSGSTGDMVTFDDSATGTKTVNLTNALTPSSVTVNAAADYTFSGAGKVTGSTGLTKSGAGKLTVLTNNDNAGTTTINAGTVQVGNGGTTGSLGTGNVVNNGALVVNRSDDVTIAGNVSGSGTITKAGNNNLAITGSTNTTGDISIAGGTLALNGGSIAGNVSGAGALAKNGAGTLVATGNVAPGAGTTISAGTLQIGNGGTAGSLAADVNFTGAATLAFNRTDAVTFGGAITGGGGVTVANGSLKLTGNLNYSGVTDLGANTLEIANNADASLTNKLLGTGTFTKSGTGQLNVLNNNPFTGTFNVNGGTVLLADLGAGGDLNATNININNGGKFVFGLGVANGGIAGENPDFPDATTVTINTGGTFEIRIGENWGNTVLNGGTFAFTGTPGATLTNGWDLRSGFITGPTTGTAKATMTGDLNKTTSGTVAISGNVTVAAANVINVNDGVLSFEAAAVPTATTAAGAINLGSTGTTGTFRMAGPGSAATTRPVNVATTGVIDVSDAAGTLTLTNPLTVTGSFTKTGAGTLKTTAAASFANGFTIAGGTYDVEPVAANPTVSSLPAGVNVTNNGNLLVNAPNTSVGTMTGTGTTTVGAAGNLTVASLTGSALANNGVTALRNATLTGGVTGTGSLTVGDGTNAAVASLGSTLNQQALTVQSAATLNLPATATHVASLVNALTVQGTGNVNLGTGGLAVDYTAAGTSAVTQLHDLIVTGRANGTWTGNGLTSSAAAANPNQLAIGYAEAPTAALAGGNTFLGQLLANPQTTALARVTYVGDANLDGKVDFSDIQSLLAANKYNKGTAAGWSDGDVNYDGVVSFSDIQAILGASVYNKPGYDAAAASNAAPAAHATPNLSAAADGPAAATTVGAAGDGKVTIVYDQGTGGIRLETDGVHLNSIDVKSLAGLFTHPPTASNHPQPNNPDNVESTFSTRTANEVAYGLIGSGAWLLDWDYGNLMNAGNGLATLLSDLTITYTVDNTVGTFTGDVRVVGTPEPTTLGLAALAAAGLLARRRRKAA